ncbi:MAG: hypothetical protein ABS862_01680 [Carnobacterium inhibens]|uniref:hypothetical protein n=1 Tax=Carnobacterium sp. TaxID=48221 RepID=UPI003315EA68
MIFHDISSGVDEENVTKKVIVEITEDGKVLRNVTLDIDKEYKVNSYSKKKMKYQDRKGVIRSFKNNEDNDELKAHIQFSDDNSLGWVDVKDLEKVTK